MSSMSGCSRKHRTAWVSFFPEAVFVDGVAYVAGATVCSALSLSFFAFLGPVKSGATSVYIYIYTIVYITRSLG